MIAEKNESPVTGKRRSYAKDLVLDLNACIFCELCVQVCPTDAIVMMRLPEEPGYSREELFLSMDRLYENEAQAPGWGTGHEADGDAGSQARPAEAGAQGETRSQGRSSEARASEARRQVRGTQSRQRVVFVSRVLSVRRGTSIHRRFSTGCDVAGKDPP